MGSRWVPRVAKHADAGWDAPSRNRIELVPVGDCRALECDVPSMGVQIDRRGSRTMLL
jgi:hypothetical protein